MTAHTPYRRPLAALLCAAGLCALVGCKTDREAKGTGVGRGKDPLFGNLIPRQDLPVPGKTATKGKTDPLVAPTGGGKTTGYNDDPERFKGTFVPGKGSTPAALSGWSKDGEGLKIESPGVELVPAGGVDVPPSVEPLLKELDAFNVGRDDRSLTRENGRWVCRASVPNPERPEARLQFTGAADTAADAVKQVLAQLAERK